MQRNIFILLLTLCLLFSTNVFAQEGYEHCLEKDESYARTLCFEPYFKELTHEKSATAAIEAAQKMKDEGVIEDCHIVAHMIGKENLYKHDYDLGKALASCPMGCIQGCIHSAVQTYVSERVDKDNLVAELGKICNHLDPESTEYFQCVHGIGHGFLTGNFLTMPEAIAACRQFDKKDAETCLGGLAMENMQRHLLMSEEALKEKLPTVCDEMASVNDLYITNMCLNAAGEGLMFYTGHDLRRSLSLCPYVTTDMIQIQHCLFGVYGEQPYDESAFPFDVMMYDHHEDGDDHHGAHEH